MPSNLNSDLERATIPSPTTTPQDLPSDFQRDELRKEAGGKRDERVGRRRKGERKEAGSMGWCSSFRFLGFSGMFTSSLPHLPGAASGIKTLRESGVPEVMPRGGEGSAGPDPAFPRPSKALPIHLRHTVRSFISSWVGDLANGSFDALTQPWRGKGGPSSQTLGPLYTRAAPPIRIRRTGRLRHLSLTKV